MSVIQFKYLIKFLFCLVLVTQDFQIESFHLPLILTIHKDSVE